MADIDHFYAETKVLKVEEQLSTLWSQYLVSNLQPENDSFPVVTDDSGPRRMKKTQQTEFLDWLEDLLIDIFLQNFWQFRSENFNSVGKRVFTKRTK